MNMDDDWLDSRMAAESYIPDDGFTASVVGRLPKRQQRPVVTMRVAILCCTGLLAFFVFLWQLPSALQGATRTLSGVSIPNFPGELSTYLQQPNVLLVVAACIILLGVVLVPLLRRWA